MIGERTVTWSRITDQEGWPDGLLRGVDLHEETGRPVQIARWDETGRPDLRIEVLTEEGFLRIRLIDDSK